MSEKWTTEKNNVFIKNQKENNVQSTIFKIPVSIDKKTFISTNHFGFSC